MYKRALSRTPFEIRIPRTPFWHIKMFYHGMYLSSTSDRSKSRCRSVVGREIKWGSLLFIWHLLFRLHPPFHRFMHNVDPLRLLFRPRPLAGRIGGREGDSFQIRSEISISEAARGKGSAVAVSRGKDVCRIHAVDPKCISAEPCKMILRYIYLNPKSPLLKISSSP